MSDLGFWGSIWHELTTAGRFRLIFQPLLAIILGLRIGLADARVGAQPFIARLIRSPNERWDLVRGSIGHAAKPLTLALLMDCLFQYLTFGRVRVLAAIIVGILLVWLPFSITRGLANRVWTSHRRHLARHAFRR